MNHEYMKKLLLELIHFKRKEMIEAADKEGYTSQLTIKCSQELDVLLNDYDQLLREKEQTLIRKFEDYIRMIWTSSTSKIGI